MTPTHSCLMGGESSPRFLWEEEKKWVGKVLGLVGLQVGVLKKGEMVLKRKKKSDFPSLSRVSLQNSRLPSEFFFPLPKSCGSTLWRFLFDCIVLLVPEAFRLGDLFAVNLAWKRKPFPL